MGGKELNGRISSATEHKDAFLPATATEVKHLVSYCMWKGQAGKMLRGQSGRITYKRRLPRDSCCGTVDELQLEMKNRNERAWYHMQVLNKCKVFVHGCMGGWMTHFRNA